MSEAEKLPDPEKQKGEGVSTESGIVERREAKLEQMAVRHRWPEPAWEHRVAVVNRQVRTAIQPARPESRVADDRRATAAAMCLAALSRINQADEHHDDGETLRLEGEVQHSHVHVDVAELLKDPDYVRYRSKALFGSDLDAGAPRGNGQPGQVDSGKAPGNGQRRTNGRSGRQK